MSAQGQGQAQGEGGCTSCGNKGGCSHRKRGLLAALDEALGRAYPTRTWGQPDDEATAGLAMTAPDIERLTTALARRCASQTVHLPAGPDRPCDLVYVLAIGRPPSLVALRENRLTPAERASLLGEAAPEERHLRVVFSPYARMAAVQEVAVRLVRHGGDLFVEEEARGGVFDPVLLRRLQLAVAVFAEHDVLHADFGELCEAPDGFDPGEFPHRHGAGAPALASYLFLPGPAAGTSLSPIVGAEAP